jgi:excisionase family DNA binding protein
MVAVLLTTEEAGRLYGIKPDTVRRMIHRGALDAWRGPRGWRVRVDPSQALTVSTSRAGAILGVQPATVRRMVRDGRLAGAKVNRRWVVSVDARLVL